MKREIVLFGLLLILVYSPGIHGVTYTIPEDLTFCGEPVPLASGDVYERLDTQLRMIGQNTGQIELWFKRCHRYFPRIEEVLKTLEYPADLKYVPVMESSLQVRARSIKHAVGPWQFIAATGRRYGLSINRHFDERLDIRKSTKAALAYLGELYKEYNSWPTALAAYNIGENRIREECYRQGTGDYYEMLLPEETDRYVFNIISAKIIMEDPSQFKIETDHIAPYTDLNGMEVTLNLSRSIPVPALAFCMGLRYREFRGLNPWVIGVEIPAGKYVFNVPVDQREGLEGRILRYYQQTANVIRFQHPRKLNVTAESGEMRIGPGDEYPVFRTLERGTTFNVRIRTKEKENDEFWYLFINDEGAEGWIWGGQVN